MSRRTKPRTGPPDPTDIADVSSCFRDSAHFHTLIGLMEQQDLRFVPVSGQTDHGVEWSAIIVQGQPTVAILEEAARRIAVMLDEQRRRDADEAAQG